LFPDQAGEAFASLRSTLSLSASYRSRNPIFRPHGILRLLWPLYSGFLSPYGGVAHRSAGSADYPCPIQAGSVPPGLRSGTGLLSFISGSPSLSRFPHPMVVDFSLSAPELDLGLSSCPRIDSRLASRRLALVCKLPLILNDKFIIVFVGRISIPWLPTSNARLPHPSS